VFVLFTVDYFREEEGSTFGCLEYKSPDRDEILVVVVVVVDNIKNIMLSAVGTKY